MNEIFYIDIYFFLNAALDAVCFFAVSRILPQHIRLLRLLTASALGGLCAAITALYPIDNITIALLFFAMSLFSTALVFVPHSLPHFMRCYALFLLSLFLLGGALCAIGTLLGISVSSQKFELWYTLVVAVLLGGIVLLFVLAQRRFRRNIQDVCLVIDGKFCYASALVDSGNLLIHPESGLSVALITEEAARFFFTPERAKALDEAQDENNKITLITPAGQKNLYGFIAEEAYVYRGGKRKRIQPFFLALDRSCHNYGGCDLIISPSVLPLT